MHTPILCTARNPFLSDLSCSLLGQKYIQPVEGCTEGYEPAGTDAEQSLVFAGLWYLMQSLCFQDPQMQRSLPFSFQHTARTCEQML
jgi:hypothetical protein